MSGSPYTKGAGSYFVVGLLTGIVLAACAFAWIGRQQANNSVAGGRVLQVAHSQPEEHPVHQGLAEFARKTEELSGGRLRLTIFPNGQLGSEAQCLEKLQSGSLDISKVSAAPVSNFVPSYKLFSLPYLFRDEAHYWKVMDGAVGRQMLEAVGIRGDGTPSGLRGLGYMDGGSRSYYARKPLRGLDDLRGMKLRVMNDVVAMDMVQAMGASPTPIAFGELYTALKQGVVDGAENNPPSFLTSGHHEICKHYLLDHHSRIPDVVLVSAKAWGALDQQERRWLEEAMAHASNYQRELWKTENLRALAQLRELGVNITEPDPAAFAEASRSVYLKHGRGDIKTLIRRIRSIK